MPFIAPRRQIPHPLSRKLLMIDAFYEEDAAPHAPTSKWSYTVPSGKELQVTAVSVGVTRNTAPTTVGEVRSAIWLDFEMVMIMAAMVRSATVGARDHAELGTSIIIPAGVNIEYISHDLSTGGICNHYGSCIAIQYDRV